MKTTIFASLAVALLIVSGCMTSAKYFQPAIENGGRTEAITIHPKDEKIIYVASSSGGLFRSVDAGASWMPVDGIPSYAVSDVEFCPDDASIVIAIAAVGFATETTGGIWRSTDGGFSWKKPKGANALKSSRCPERNGAYSISFEAGTKNVYVATDCGVAISNDRGATWSHKAFTSSNPVNNDSTQNRQFSVQSAANNRVWSAGNDGLWYSSDNGKNWNKSTTNLKGRGGSPHAFAPSPFDSKFGYLVAHDNRLYQTSNGGQSWTWMGDPGRNNRPPFVRTSLSVSGKQKEFDVYFGDGVDLNKKTFKQENNSVKSVSTSWTKLNLKHADPCDIAFHHNDRDPFIAASDGGLHTTKDKGKTWNWMGGGAKGYGALQITEITGQFVTSGNKHTDLYFGTQDNDLWASSNGGITWPNKFCCEGFYLRVPRSESNPSQTRVTGVACAGCYNFITEADFKNRKGWQNPPDGDSKNDSDGSPFLIRKDHYYQVAIDQDHAPNVRKIMFTDNTGKSWKQKATTTANLYNRPQISSPSQNQTKIYHCVMKNTFTPKGDKIYGLVRIEDIYKTNAIVSNAEGTGFGSIGIFTTMFAWYPVFAVNPKDPDHLMAADVQHGYMTISYDGGKTWNADKKLTKLITENGKFLFERGRFSLVTNISFDPDRPCRILIGTRQNGAFYTVNGGQTWKAVSGTKPLYNISSFFFAGKTVYMSTYGRGLFKLDLDEGQTSCTYVQLPKKSIIHDTTIVVKPKSGEKSAFKGIDDLFCDECTIALASESHMTDIQIDDGMIRRVGIAGGSLIHIRTGKEPVPIPFEVFLEKRTGEFSGNLSLQRLANDSLPIRGLILRGSEIVAVIIGSKSIELEEFPPANIDIQAETGIGIEYVPAGQTFFIYGTNFSPPQEAGPVTIFLDGEPIYETETNAEGGFVVFVMMPELNVGIHNLTAIQESPARFISMETVLRIVVNDWED